jgi:hypothetical protein
MTNTKGHCSLFIASMLTGKYELHPVGFFILSGNDDLASWTKMLALLNMSPHCISR